MVKIERVVEKQRNWGVGGGGREAYNRRVRKRERERHLREIERWKEGERTMYAIGQEAVGLNFQNNGSRGKVVKIYPSGLS